MNVLSNSRLFLLLAFATLVACSRSENETPTAAAEAASTAETAAAAGTETPKPEHPALVVSTFDGGTFDLSRHRGGWVVVNFWATWCTPCLKEIPELDAFDKSRDDVAVIGLAYEEIARPDMEAFLREHSISYAIAVIDVYNPPVDFDVPRGLPMTYLIAPDGRVGRKFLGPITSADLVEAMKASESTPAAA